VLNSPTAQLEQLITLYEGFRFQQWRNQGFFLHCCPKIGIHGLVVSLSSCNRASLPINCVLSRMQQRCACEGDSLLDSCRTSKASRCIHCASFHFECSGPCSVCKCCVGDYATALLCGMKALIFQPEATARSDPL
jgi:hypothetical protein